MIEVESTRAFDIWLENLREREQIQVKARIERIQNTGHFGDFKNLGNKLFELRWKNGWRVYFCRSKNGIILLLGGSKNAQEKDIEKARL
jgi:putative addiction module killer protein